MYASMKKKKKIKKKSLERNVQADFVIIAVVVI